MFELCASHKHHWTQSNNSDKSTFRFLKTPTLNPDSAGTKSFSGGLTPIAAAPCYGLRLNFRSATIARRWHFDRQSVSRHIQFRGALSVALALPQRSLRSS